MYQMAIMKIFFLLFNLAPKTIYSVYVMLFVLFAWKPDVFCIERVSECFILQHHSKQHIL